METGNDLSLCYRLADMSSMRAMLIQRWDTETNDQSLESEMQMLSRKPALNE